MTLGAYDPTNKEICVKLPVFVIVIEGRIGSLAVFLVVISADELLKRLRGSIVPADAAGMPEYGQVGLYRSANAITDRRSVHPLAR